jgi:hypothetical protein
MRQFKNGVKVLFVMACAAICVRTTQADEKTLSPAEAIKLMSGQNLITLHLKNATPQEFYSEIWKQTPLPPFDATKFKFWRNPPAISLDVDNEPFWLVMQQVAHKYGMSVATFGNSSREEALGPYQSAGSLNGQAVSAPPFLFTINTIEHSLQRTMHIDSPDKQPEVRDRLQLTIRIFSDLKFPLLREGTTVTVTQAINDKGVSLLQQNPTERQASGFDKFQAYFPLELTPQPTNGGLITSLKGAMRIVIATKNTTWEIGDLIKSGDAERGTEPKVLTASEPLDDVAYYAVKNVKPIDNGVSFDLIWLRSHTPLGVWAIEHAMSDNVSVVDDKGIELKHSGGFGTGRFGVSDPLNNKLQGFTSHLKYIRTDKNSPSGPIKLIWKYPLELRAIEVPFEFKNLPLP